MTTDKNQTLRAEHITVFITAKRITYLSMIDYIRKRLAVHLGADFNNTCRAEEIMHEIFGDLIDGTRAWNMDKYNLEQVLWMDIKSEISNLAKKEKRFVSVPCKSYDEEDNGGIKNMDALVNTLPEDVEGSIDAESIEKYCFDVLLKDDEDSQIIFNELLLGNKQKKIAGDLGLSEDQTEIIIRKIRRTISKNIPSYMLENLSPGLKEKILKYS